MKTSKRAQALLEATRPEQHCLRALLVFAAQNPGFEWGNYSTGDWKRSRAAYLGDSRPVAKQLRDIRGLKWRFSELTDEVLREVAPHTYCGRLSFVERDGGTAVDYCTGQYWPTEYRQASLAVIRAGLALVDRRFERENRKAA